MIGCLVFYGGVCQFIAGVIGFITGDTVGFRPRPQLWRMEPLTESTTFYGQQFGATVFSSYAAFNLSYAMIYLPGSGIMAAYTDPATGAVSPAFDQAIAIYLWAWLIVTALFTVAAVRSSWVLFVDLLFLDVCLLLLACGFMTQIDALITAGYSFGIVVSFLSCMSHRLVSVPHQQVYMTDDSWTDWAGCAGLWSDGRTPIKLPTFDMGPAA